MNAKAKKFKKFLDDQKITVFEIEEIKDDFHTAAFRSRMEVDGQILPMVVILDDSIYGMLRLQIIDKILKGAKEEQLLPYLNQLNQKYKIFKYYVNEEGALLLDCCLPSSEESFDGELVRALIEVMLQHITEEYPNLMKKVWSESTPASNGKKK